MALERPWPAVMAVMALLATRPAMAQLTDNAVNTETPLLDQLISPTSVGSGTAFEPGVTVATRVRPEYASSGVTFGNLTIRPQLTESTGYDSNVLGTRAPHGSALVETNASLSAVEDWSPATSLNLSASVDDNRYLSQAQQSFTDWSAGIGGMHEFGRDVFTAQYTHTQSVLTPLTLDVPQLDTPIPYGLDLVQLRYRANLATWFVIPALDVGIYRFGNGSVGGIPYLQNYRDRVVVSPSVLVGYELAPRRSLVAIVRDSIATYANQPMAGSITPFTRDYNDAALLGGADYDIDSAIRLRALVGYEMRDFRSSRYKTISAPVAEATAIWTPRAATTITGTLARHIQDSADDTTAAFTETYGQLRVDEEYLPNVLLRASAGIYITDYEGGGSQTLYSADATATYLLNRDLQIVATYDFSARQSRVSGSGLSITDQAFGPSYTDHRVLLQLRLRL
jgi:hypothetical protein